MMAVFVIFWIFIAFVALFFALGDAITRIVIGWARVDSE